MAFMKWRWHWPTLLAGYWLVIFGATHFPGTEHEILPAAIPWDKFAHAGAYFFLGLLLACVIVGRNENRARRYALVFLIAAVYGALDEVSQHFIPHRSPDVLDWCADITGCGLALLCHSWWSRRGGGRG